MITTLEADALARKLGLRFDGAQDPCGAAAMTGSKEHEKLAFTCIAPGAAQGVTFYCPLDATAEQITDRWNVKLAEVFAAEHQELKRKLGALQAAVEIRQRIAWEAGFKLAVAYGDNHVHCEGEQKEKQWSKFIALYGKE